MLSIRQDDLRTLAVIYDQSPSVLTEQLINWGVLDADARRAVAHEEGLNESGEAETPEGRGQNQQ